MLAFSLQLEKKFIVAQDVIIVKLKLLKVVNKGAQGIACQENLLWDWHTGEHWGSL